MDGRVRPFPNGDQFADEFGDLRFLGPVIDAAAHRERRPLVGRDRTPQEPPGGAGVRAYRSDGMTFETSGEEGIILDSDGNEWTVTENALIGPDGEELRRMGGHLAFWFGWFSFFPDTVVYEGMM